MKFLLFFFGLLINISSKGDAYQVFDEKGKKGIKNDAGQIIIPATFDALGWSDGKFSVIGQTTGYRLRGKWGLINLKKEFVTTADFEELTYTGGEYVIAKKKMNPISVKTGCLNLRGELKIPFQYDGISISGLRAIVFNLTGSRYDVGLADLQNQILIPLSNKNIFPLGTLRYAVENRSGKIALFSEDGKPITDFTIDSISRFTSGFFTVYQNGLRGLMNRDGELKIPIQYSDIQVLGDGNVRAQMLGEWHFLNQKDELVMKLSADALQPVSRNRTIIFLGGKCGLLNEQQKLILPFQWNKLKEIAPDIFLANNNGKLGILRLDNTYLIPLEYDSIDKTSNGFRVYKQSEGWQLLNESGKPITTNTYENIESYNGSTWLVKSRGYAGVVSNDGVELVHCVFDSIGDRTTSLVAVKFKNQYGIIDYRENWKVAPQPFPIRLANDERYLQIEKSYSFLKGIAGNVIYFTSYPVRFEKEYWVEVQSGKENTISYDGMSLHLSESLQRTGNSTSENRARFQLHEGLMGIVKDGKFGFVDATGKLAIANRYDSISNFQEGVAPIKLIGKWGFINTNDELVIQPNYESVTSFIHGLCVVKRNRMMGIINKIGRQVVSLKYNVVERLADGKFLLTNNGLLGLASDTGLVLIEPRFSFLKEVQPGYLLVSQANKWGLLTTEGLDIIPLKYDSLEFDSVNNQYIGMLKSQWKQVSAY
jgi:hypothetical protein